MLLLTGIQKCLEPAVLFLCCCCWLLATVSLSWRKQATVPSKTLHIPLPYQCSVVPLCVFLKNCQSAEMIDFSIVAYIFIVKRGAISLR